MKNVQEFRCFAQMFRAMESMENASGVEKSVCSSL